MFTEWTSLTNEITSNVNGSQSQSTLNKFNPLMSRDVTATLVKNKICSKDPVGLCVYVCVLEFIVKF